MSRTRVLLAGVAGLLALASTGSAARIVGTNGNDTLRGTAAADRLYGNRGNDTLYGDGGNDLLVPGLGRDTVYCGRGRDRVNADYQDRVSKDCEVVKRTIPPPPPSPPPPPPRPSLHRLHRRPAATTAGACRHVRGHDEPEREGHVRGAVRRDRRSGTSSLSDVNLSCQPPDLVSLNAARERHWRGSRSRSSPTGRSSSSSRSRASSRARRSRTVKVAGQLLGSTTASGKFEEKFTVDLGFIVISCTAPNVTWTASL